MSAHSGRADHLTWTSEFDPLQTCDIVLDNYLTTRSAIGGHGHGGAMDGGIAVAVVIIMDGAEAVGITMAGRTIIIGKLDSMIEAAQ